MARLILRFTGPGEVPRDDLARIRGLPAAKIIDSSARMLLVEASPAFDLEANGDNHSSRLAHQPIDRQKRPLVVSAAGKKEGTRQVIR